MLGSVSHATQPSPAALRGHDRGVAGNAEDATSGDGPDAANGSAAPSADHATNRAERVALEQEQAQLSELRARDREVRAHEQAHAAVGGSLTGAPTYEYQRGPDGVQYAVGGHVQVRLERSSDPAITLRNAEQARRAALAPAEPSSQDRSVAAAAAQMAGEARLELARQRAEESALAAEQKAEASDAASSGASSGAPSGASSGSVSEQPSAPLAPNQPPPTDSSGDPFAGSVGNQSGSDGNGATTASHGHAEQDHKTAAYQAVAANVELGRSIDITV